MNHEVSHTWSQSPSDYPKEAKRTKRAVHDSGCHPSPAATLIEAPEKSLVRCHGHLSQLTVKAEQQSPHTSAIRLPQSSRAPLSLSLQASE